MHDDSRSVGLAALQEDFLGLVMQPWPVLDAARRNRVSLRAIVDEADDERAASRLAIYARMHFLRLHASLLEDFPCVARALGAEVFERLTAEHLLTHPPDAPTLRRIGERFPDLLAKHPALEDRPHLVDVARLEWARLDVFDAVDVEPLTFDELASCARAGAELRLALVPAARLLTLAHSADAVWEALDTGGADLSAAPALTHVLVWRADHVVRHRRVDARERAALGLLSRGATLDELAAIYEEPAPLHDALCRWTLDRALMTRAVDVPYPPHSSRARAPRRARASSRR